MFENVAMAPPDAILGSTEAFNNDPRADKINLGVGVYKDENGTTPILGSVKQAETRLLDAESTKSYLPMPGAPEYAAAVQALLFGRDHEIVAAHRAVTAHTPGGTGALRVAGDFIKQVFPSARIWVSDPTWANHKGVFGAAGLEINTYPYYDQDRKALAFDAMMRALEDVPATDVVLLHACCHNPTGMDPSSEQWQAIARAAETKGFVPFIDFAYQGLGDGVEEDASGLRTLCGTCPELLVASSFSKNLGLYRERTGALTLVAGSKDAAQRCFSQLKLCVRRNYSNPPAHGGAIATTVLNDPELRTLWEGEVKDMRDRINGMRRLFVETLAAKGVEQDFSFITRQRGMFSFSGLNKEHVDRLREQHAIYIVGSGRINVAGMTPANMDRLCEAIAEVLA